MSDGFSIAHNALVRGLFLWRKRRKTETEAEYISKRDKAIVALYNAIVKPTTNTEAEHE